MCAQVLAGGCPPLSWREPENVKGPFRIVLKLPDACPFRINANPVAVGAK